MTFRAAMAQLGPFVKVGNEHVPSLDLLAALGVTREAK